MQDITPLEIKATTFTMFGKTYERAAVGGGKIVVTALHTGTSRTFSSARAAQTFIDALREHLAGQAVREMQAAMLKDALVGDLS